MVGFDGCRCGGAAFHHIGIKRALDKEFHVFQLVGFFLEGMNKFSADGLTFLSGSVTPFRRERKC